jgi:hypothetical protein
LISVSTCPAAVPSWEVAGVLAAGAEAELEGAEGGALAVPGPLGCGDGPREDVGAVGVALAPAWRARAAAWRGGTVTTAGATATAIPAGLAAQAGAPGAPHPAAAGRALAGAGAGAGLAENTPRAR